MTETIVILPDTHFEEVWRAVPGSPGYEISNKGRLRSYLKSGAGSGFRDEPRLRTPTTDKDGYLRVQLRGPGGSRNVTIHRLVAETFLADLKFEGAIVLHGDGDPQNNTVENLRWGTHAENTSDRAIHGTLGLARTPEEILEMKRLYEMGFYQREIARVFKTSQCYVHEVLTGKKRKDAQ